MCEGAFHLHELSSRPGHMLLLLYRALHCHIIKARTRRHVSDLLAGECYGKEDYVEAVGTIEEHYKHQEPTRKVLNFDAEMFQGDTVERPLETEQLEYDFEETEVVTQYIDDRVTVQKSERKLVGTEIFREKNCNLFGRCALLVLTAGITDGGEHEQHVDNYEDQEVTRHEVQSVPVQMSKTVKKRNHCRRAVSELWKECGGVNVFVKLKYGETIIYFTEVVGTEERRI